MTRDDHERYHQHGRSSDMDPLPTPDPVRAYDPQPVTFTEPVSHTIHQNSEYEHDPTCPACLDELGTELEAEYRAAILRNQDRAQEARAGAHDIRTHYAAMGERLPMAPQNQNMRDADTYHANQYRDARAQRDIVRQARPVVHTCNSVNPTSVRDCPLCVQEEIATLREAAAATDLHTQREVDDLTARADALDRYGRFHPVID